MQRIVDGILFEGKASDTGWDVRVWEANGHREVSCKRAIAWTELGPVPPLDDWASEEERLEAEAERREKSLIRAGRRARTLLRRIIKAEGFDELLTLTYKGNQQDWPLCKAHFKAWVRRMKKAIPGFRYAAAFERQERGAMHVHLCTYRLPKHASFKGVKVEAWKLGTLIWRDVVGELGGMCFVGGKPGSKRKGARMGGAKMAAYVSKYVTKDYADAAAETNRYSRSDCIPVGNKTLMRFNCSHHELLELVFEVPEGSRLVDWGLGRFKDGQWLCTEPVSALSRGLAVL